MRITRLLSQLVDTYGPYIPFVGTASPTATSEASISNYVSENGDSVEEPSSKKMKHRKGQISGSPPKGKGKGKAMSAGSGEAVDLKDLPITLHEFANGDQTKLPRYHAVLRRNEGDGIGMEDIDSLQLELEALLSSTVVRKVSLQEEAKVLQNAEKYRGQGKYLKKGPASPGKRGNGGKESRSAKKLKTAGISGGKPSTSESSSKVIGVPKLKTEAAAPAFDPLQNEQIRPVAETSKPAMPKNETPNRFWAFVEPYCAPITQDDIKLLEDLIKTHSDMSEFYRVPKLGQHYTQRWAKEDLENERVKGAGDSTSADKNDEVGSHLKKASEAANSEDCPYGELTQRLVAGLMEENVLNLGDDLVDNSTKKGSGGDSSDTENVAAAKGQLIKSLNITNSEGLEARVKKELEEQGILDPNEEDPAENDEILEELHRCQNELKAVSSHNLQQLKRLLKAAKEEMARQELRNKLQTADNDVMEAYRKISAARSKKKPPSKKERDQAWKALKEREIILKQLEAI